jgi:saccharopine dehydrogenase-like NADP-dependent oxidoreductase
MPRNVLVVGAGLISPPLVRYLLTRTPHRLVVAAQDLTRIGPLLEEHPSARGVSLDVADSAALEALVREADVVVSLLPAVHNPRLARAAIARRIPFVNTSFVSEELRSLDDAAREAGVLLLSEVGLDPGLDHMSAVRAIRRVRAEGGTITGLMSCCGGVPAPDANDNPWGYKFSWFPRAVMLAARSRARYRRSGRTIEVPELGSFLRCWPYPVPGQGLFEVYPNRDALAYQGAYALSGTEDLFRGTLRHPGWCATLAALASLGLLDLEERDWPPGTTYRDVTARLLDGGAGSLVDRLAARLGLDADAGIIARLEWAGLLSDREIPERRACPLDVLVNRLQRLMRYGPGERDMVLLEHRLLARFPDGHALELTSSLTQVGQPWGDSAMARTVSLPAAIATRLLLDGGFPAAGVQIPVMPEIYGPVLGELEELGVALSERRSLRFPGPLDPGPEG